MIAAASTEGLLRELAPQVLGAVVRRYGDFADAEDAVQEALVAAATTWPAEGQPDNPLGWLIRVASRRMVDQYRRDDARRRREDLAASWSVARPDPGPGPGRHRDGLTLSRAKVVELGDIRCRQCPIVDSDIIQRGVNRKRPPFPPPMVSGAEVSVLGQLPVEVRGDSLEWCRPRKYSGCWRPGPATDNVCEFASAMSAFVGTRSVVVSLPQ